MPSLDAKRGGTLRVFMLNTWLAPRNWSQDYQDREARLIEYLTTEEFDIAILLEVWPEEGYKRIQQATAQRMPHSHYYKGGVIGTGICIISKHEILQAWSHSCKLNGYLHKVILKGECDALIQRGPAVALIDYRGTKMYVVGFHASAIYNNIEDNLEIRTAQSVEVHQLIRNLQLSGHPVVLGGDFNQPPSSVGYKVIQSTLNDAWTRVHQQESDQGNTFVAVEENCYSDLPKGVRGYRIDFLMYQSGITAEMAVQDCHVVKETVQATGGKPLSDHYGLIATFKLQNIGIASDTNTPVVQTDDVVFEEARQILHNGSLELQTWKQQLSIGIATCLALSLLLAVALATTLSNFLMLLVYTAVVLVCVCLVHLRYYHVLVEENVIQGILQSS